MKVKEVQMEKLFSLEKYNNERIGFVAEVEEGENPDKVAADLHFKILDIEDCLNAYRQILKRINWATDSFGSKQSEIARLEQQLKEMKIKIEELTNLAGKGDIDAKLQHACSRQSYKDMMERLTAYKKELDNLDAQIKTLTDSKMKLRNRMKTGIFSLKDIDIPTVSRSAYY